MLWILHWRVPVPSQNEGRTYIPLCGMCLRRGLACLPSKLHLGVIEFSILITQVHILRNEDLPFAFALWTCGLVFPPKYLGAHFGDFLPSAKNPVLSSQRGQLGLWHYRKSDLRLFKSHRGKSRFLVSTVTAVNAPRIVFAFSRVRMLGVGFFESVTDQLARSGKKARIKLSKII
jgi:hypothetical protein